MSQPTEIWRPVVGHEGAYEVSNQGRVRSIDRWVEYTWKGKVCRRFFKGQPKKLAVSTNGYRRAAFNRREYEYVHVLVLNAFAPPRPPGSECRHLNGDPLDNRIENLAWGTRSENSLDRVEHGTHNEAKKTRCIRGHDFTSENTRVFTTRNGRPGRSCRECERIRNRENMRKYRARKKAS